MPAPSYAPLDEALEILAPYGIELRNGNSNHAPMGAEALCAMGRPDAVLPWIGRYRERMLPRSEAGDRIRRQDWRGALRDRCRFGDAWRDPRRPCRAKPGRGRNAASAPRARRRFRQLGGHLSGAAHKPSRPEWRDGAAAGDHPSADRTARSPEPWRKYHGIARHAR